MKMSDELARPCASCVRRRLTHLGTSPLIDWERRLYKIGVIALATQRSIHNHIHFHRLA